MYLPSIAAVDSTIGVAHGHGATSACRVFRYGDLDKAGLLLGDVPQLPTLTVSFFGEDKKEERGQIMLTSLLEDLVREQQSRMLGKFPEVSAISWKTNDANS